jgi:predicted lysophospholipase L1 biosynthesis ABC-type transport system permease subunit
MKSRQFKKGLTTLLFAACLALAAAPLAWGQSLDEAAQQAARQHDAKVLSAQTVQEGKRRVHVIKLLTKDGVVKTVRVPVREG